MVILNKIYTKTGDSGETALGNGARVAKFSLRVARRGSALGRSDLAYGAPGPGGHCRGPAEVECIYRMLRRFV